MASLAPAFIKLYYTFSGIQHVQTIPVAPSGALVPGVMPSLNTKSASPVTMAVGVDAYVVLLKAMYGATVDINNAEFWSQPLESDDPIWIYTHPIGVIGTNSTASVLMTQMVISFRTGLGGIYKLYMMEPSGFFPVNVRETYPFVAGVATNLANYLIGSTSWFAGRDNGVLVVPINRTTKFNDALRKRRLLI